MKESLTYTQLLKSWRIQSVFDIHRGNNTRPLGIKCKTCWLRIPHHYTERSDSGGVAIMVCVLGEFKKKKKPSYRHITEVKISLLTNRMVCTRLGDDLMEEM